jgi:hypothetical protein
MSRAFSPHALVLAGFALTQACAGAPTRLTITALRARAAAAADLAAAQRDLGLAELFAYDGDTGRAEAALARALALDPDDPVAALAAGIEHDVHGNPAGALDAYLRALRAAATSVHPWAPHVAELASQALGGVREAAPGYTERVLAEAQAVFELDALPMPARAEVAGLLVQLAYRRGDRAAADAVVRRMGCVVDWRVAGPFGPRELLSFDEEHLSVTAPLAPEYDLGPGRGVRATRTAGTRGCTLQLGGGPVALGGTSYAQGELEITRAGRHTIRVDTPNNIDVILDGRSILRIDRRTQLLPRVNFVAVDLSAGRHRITLKLASRHPSPVASVALLPERPTDPVAVALPSRADVEAGFPRYLRSAIAMVRGDVLGARATLGDVSARTPASPLLWMQRANVLLADPMQAEDVREDAVRRLLARAAARDAKAWYPPVHLARLAATNGRVKEALAALRDARTRWPRVSAIALGLVDLLRERGWHAEADRIVADARRIVPDACGPLSREIDGLRRRKREHQAAPLIEALMACEGESNGRYGLALRRRDWGAAQAELARLRALDASANRQGWLLAAIELAKNRQDGAALDASLAELRAQFPRADNAVAEEFDRLLAQGRREDALASLERALGAEPAAMASLRRLVPIAGGEHALARYRRDGSAEIAKFEASGRRYDAPQVLVFDYMAGRLFDDGSSLELVHTIQKAQSSEAVDDLAEVHVPEGALVLTLRAIKPDGRRLEPDAIAGKDTISLPSVEPGDYVEFEFIVRREPPEGMPGTYLGERFYFQSFEIPFDHSEMLLILPEDAPYVLDPRGAAPALVERVDGGLRMLRWQVDQSASIKGEPDAVNPREYVPSVRVGIGGSWRDFVDGVRDVLVDRDVFDPEIAALASRIVGNAAPTDFSLRARRLYAWTLAHVEQSDEMFAQAATMLRARSGNRTRVLHYLLRLAGVPARLALARSMASDQTRSSLADGDTYDQLLVTFDDRGRTTWLHTVERWAPFGYLPPLLRGQPAVLLEPGAPERTLPPGAEGADRRTLTIDLLLTADGGARFDVVEDVRGAGAVAWREQLESVPAAELHRRFEEEYVARLVPGATLRSVRIAGRRQSDPSMKLAYAFAVRKFARAEPGGQVIPSILPTRLAANYARASARATNQLVDNPLDVDVVLRIHPPPGGKPPRLPEDLKLVAALGERPSFALRYRWDGRALSVMRSVRVPAMRVTPGEYAAFARLCHDADVAEARELVFRLPPAR